MPVKTLIVIALAFAALGAFRWAVMRPRPVWLAPAIAGVATAALLWRFGAIGIAAGAVVGGLVWWFTPKGPAPDLDLAQARTLLGVSESATRDEIRAAHRRLISTAHPDRGGAQGQAARLNAARDLLLRKLKA
ncbi:MAG: DnaJ domain-containing protein [Alphaproteobacteria bacterium]|nr:DnaJ domain-containing protein [Alphaproteobacteria bacterium]